MTKSRIIIALDYPDAKTAKGLVDQLDPARCRVKVGKELFTAAGPAFVSNLVDQGFDVFLDLKFHDIPNTVAKACQAAAGLGVWMLNVHALGGGRMLTAAREAIDTVEHKPLLIAVTVLTSMGPADLEQVGLSVDPKEQVKRLALLAQESGIDGVVCSPLEVAMLREHIDPSFKLVTPGIRPKGADVGDQTRIMTPAEAVAAGSDYLVIGRPITQQPDPMAALVAIEKEMS